MQCNHRIQCECGRKTRCRYYGEGVDQFAVEEPQPQQTQENLWANAKPS